MRLTITISGILILLLFTGFTTFGKKDLKLTSINELDTIDIDCDSIYPEQGISITHIKYEHESDGYLKEKNSVFIYYKTTAGVKEEIYRDTIFSRLQTIKFEDFNNDRVKDILVENISDVRSNLTYYLYLVNPVTYRLAKIKGFEEIKNPKYKAKYDIIDNYVMSGQNWTSFYKINNNRVRDLNIVIYDDGNTVRFDKMYKKAIIRITERR